MTNHQYSVVGFLLPQIGENGAMVVTYQSHRHPGSTSQTGQNKRKESGDGYRNNDQKSEKG